MRRVHRNGIALLVVTGLLTLLAVFGTAWARMAFLLRGRTNIDLNRAQARLLAQSGLHYASARLFRGSLAPTPPTVANQPDDWTYRDGPGVPLESSLNPSYAQTEPYDDVYPVAAPSAQTVQSKLGSTGNARYDARQDPFTDLDGNGRFDSWSGRLRDQHGLTGGTFALKILPESGKINLNGGWLDAGDRDDDGHFNSSYPYNWVPPSKYGNGVLDHCDEREIRNRRYALLLDNLGQIVNVSSTTPPEVPTGAASRLGDLLKSRPLGGFRSMEEIQGRLSPSDWGKVKDFLTVTEAERAKFSVHDKAGTGLAERGIYLALLGTETRPLVNLGAASKEVLQALVLGLEMGTGGLPAATRPVDPALALKTSNYLGQSGPFASWYDFYVKLHRDNPSVDPQSAGYETAVQILNSSNYDLLAYSWANVVFGNFVADEAGGSGVGLVNALGNLYGPVSYSWFPPMSWHTYDTPRATAADYPYFHRIRKMGPSQFMWGGRSTIWRKEGGRPPLPPTSQQWAGWYSGGTLEVSLIPREVAAFSIDCLGRSRTGVGRSLASAGASALFRVGTIVSARTQEEFEDLARFSDLGFCTIVERPRKDRTQTEPQFSIDSLPPEYRSFKRARYSPFWGTIRLADRSGYRQRERFYVPAWDVDQPLRPSSSSAAFEDNFQDVSGETDFKHEWDPQFVNAPGLRPEELTSLEAVFRGERSWSFNCAAAPGVSAAGTYTWLQGKTFALDDGTGSVTQGALELWTTGKPGGLSQRRLGLFWSDPNSTGPDSLPDIDITGDVYIPPSISSSSLSPAVLYVNRHLSSPIVVGDWHHLVVVLDTVAVNGDSAPTMVVYLDGKPDPFLANSEWEPGTVNPTYRPKWIAGQGVTIPPLFVAGVKVIDHQLDASAARGGYLGSEVDELRLYDKALTQNEAMAHALSSRYWTEERFPPAEWKQEVKSRLVSIPSFTSPLYVFNRLIALDGARWDGFVPQLIREAVDGSGEVVPAAVGLPSQAPPMRVELLCYPGSDPNSPCRVVPFPEALWRSGGGWAEFKTMWQSAYGNEPTPKFRAFRYRVWMDCSAIDGFNPETPVFDSISMVFKSAHRMLDLRLE